MVSVGLIVRICLRVLVGSGSVSMMRLSGCGSLIWIIQRYGKRISTHNMGIQTIKTLLKIERKEKWLIQ